MSVCGLKLPKSVAFLTACLLLVSGGASAHIKNEASQFPDIEFSQSRFDIVVLVGAGIIPQTPVFEPDKPLSELELASWIALAKGLGVGGETPDTDKLAAAALDQGVVTTLDGEANYGDLNKLFFDGQLTVEDASRTPTKAEAATFIARQLDTDHGRTLMESLGLRIGIIGPVTAVTSKPNEFGGSSYVVTVGDTLLPMYAHGRVANGPTDLLQWKGREVRRSFVRGEGDDAIWIYLEAEPLQDVVESATPVAEKALGEKPQEGRGLLYLLICAVVILGLALFFFRGRRSG